MVQQIEEDLWAEFEEELKKVEQIRSRKVLYPKDCDHQAFWDLFLTTRFPEGQINSILEKNFAVWIVQHQLDIKTVKEKYHAQNWNVGALLGWLRKVEKGEIVEYNVGELINWAKEMKRDDLVLMLVDKAKIEEPDKPDFNFIWDKDLQSYEEEKKDWIIEKYIPRRSVGVWTGKRGTFKTFVTLSAIYSIGAETPFLGTFLTKRCNILYLDKENGAGVMKDRVQMIKNGMDCGEVPIGFIFFSNIKLDRPTDFDIIEDLIKENGIDLLVVDTYRRAIRFDENDAGAVSHLFVDYLRPLAERYNCSIILIHHDRKSNGEGGDEMDMIRGSSDLANYCDFILKNERNGNSLVLKQLKMRSAPEQDPIAVEIDTDEESYIKFVSTGKYEKKSADQKAVDYLLEWFNETSLSQFTSKMGAEYLKQYNVGRKQYYEALDILVNSGVIIKVGRGIYDIKLKGESFD